MNDEELNVMIARTEEEISIFRDIDIRRERDTLDAWRAGGNRGKPPPSLMQFEELPECYQNDEPFEVKETDESIEGRGQRRRNVVSYNDGLSDEQWAIVSLPLCFSFWPHWISLINLHERRLWKRVKIYKSSQSALAARRIDGQRISC